MITLTLLIGTLQKPEVRLSRPSFSPKPITQTVSFGRSQLVAAAETRDMKPSQWQSSSVSESRLEPQCSRLEYVNMNMRA